MKEEAPRIVVTGTAWMGGGIGSIETAIHALFREARREVSLTVYAVSGGADLVLDEIDRTLQRGLLVRLVANRFSDQPADVVARLRGLAAAHPHFELFDFAPDGQTDLHAKVIVADRQVALVGSSNLSRRGLLDNFEMAVYLHGPSAETVASAIDRLITRGRAKRVSLAPLR